MSIKERHKQALADLKVLDSIYTSIDDYCGAWCNNSVLNDMLKNPTKANATSHLESQIEWYFSGGAQNYDNYNGRGCLAVEIDTTHPDVYEIGKRRGLI